MQVFDANNKPYEAVVYVANAKTYTESGKPDFEYLQRILRGGKHHGLSENYIRQIEIVSQWG
jgi:hypothetical protein